MTDTASAEVLQQRTELQILVAVETLVSEHEIVLGIEDRTGNQADRLRRVLARYVGALVASTERPAKRARTRVQAR